MQYRWKPVASCYSPFGLSYKQFLPGIYATKLFEDIIAILNVGCFEMLLTIDTVEVFCVAGRYRVRSQK